MTGAVTGNPLFYEGCPDIGADDPDEAARLQLLERGIVESAFELLQLYHQPVKYWTWNLLDPGYLIDTTFQKPEMQTLLPYREQLIGKLHQPFDNIYLINCMLLNMRYMNVSLFL